MGVSEVARPTLCPEKWLPTVTTGIELTATGWSAWAPRSRAPRVTHAPRARPRSSGYFAILEAADDEEGENDDDEILSLIHT